MTPHERLYIASRKHYIHFLKFTNPNKPAVFDAAPDNLLELLDNAHRRFMKYRDLHKAV